MGESDNSEKNGTTTSSFISLEYIHRWEDGQARIQWPSPNTLTSVVQLAITGAETSCQLQAKPSVLQAQIQEQLAQLDFYQSEAIEGDYTLTFSKPNEVSSTLCWSAKTETSELGALRNQVEETAHLAYVKS
ncbi:MAG: hypothetical protein VSS75_015235, partial [Candidatus Parabeggiatoa sp.]|nr:hypothetical protein [Candidatus Parabeggiatoa sp.]